MEGLVLLVLELILPLGVLVGALLLEAVALLAGLLQVVFRRGTRLSARWRRLTLGAALAVALALILCQTVFFQPIVRRLAAAVQARSGIELRFARASGSLLGGRVVLHDAVARRSGDPASTFDVAAREMAVDVRLLGLLGGTASLESVHLTGARGTYTRFAGVERPPRKRFTADVLLVEDLDVAWTLRRPGRPDFTLPLRVERLEARPFAANDAAYALLFRSKARGTLAGAPFTLENGTWSAERVPVRPLADFLGEPFDWLSGGAADVVVTHAWRDDGKVDLFWKGAIRDPKAAVPERLAGFRRTLAEGMVALVNRKPREIPLDFTLSLKGEGFKGSMSLEGLELWDALAEAVAVELSEAVGLKPETGKKGLDWLKRKLAPK